MALRFAELFSGIGFVRLGLEKTGKFQCVFANDICKEKKECYDLNFYDPKCAEGDVKALPVSCYTEVDLLTASFPCTDVSGAGARGVGIAGSRSGVIMDVLRKIGESPEKPRVLFFENVPYLLISNGGADIIEFLHSVVKAGYPYVDVRILCASAFTPQCRKRIFITACRQYSGETFQISDPPTETQPAAIRRLQREASAKISGLILMKLAFPALPKASVTLPDIVTHNVPEAAWFGEKRTTALMKQFSARNLQRMAQHRYSCVAFVQSTAKTGVTAYPKWDGTSPCIRRALGGGNVAKLLFLESGKMREMQPIEYIRLQGGPDDYKFPPSWKRAKIASALGDAVCVPVIAFMAEHVLAKLLAGGE
jgi:DNA (cytosine-5)-methyltransferase 1